MWCMYTCYLPLLERLLSPLLPPDPFFCPLRTCCCPPLVMLRGGLQYESQSDFFSRILLTLNFAKTCPHFGWTEVLLLSWCNRHDARRLQGLVLNQISFDVFKSEMLDAWRKRLGAWSREIDLDSASLAAVPRTDGDFALIAMHYKLILQLLPAECTQNFWLFLFECNL